MEAEEQVRWLNIADRHDRECAHMQACCEMASSEGADAIRRLVVSIAEEREACALIADSATAEASATDPISAELARLLNSTARIIAAAIRARA